MPPRRLDGADDCMVVSVVVRERTECVGDEKLLSLTAPPVVIVVPALEGAVSELSVSGLVDTVGAADLVLLVGAGWPSLEAGRDSLLCDGETLLILRPDGGVWNDKCLFPLLGIGAAVFDLPELGYGLFLEMLSFLDFESGGCWLRLLAPLDVESEEEFFRFASRFIQLEKGLRRECLSRLILVSNKGYSIFIVVVTRHG